MHDFEIINQYRSLYLSLLKKHSLYSVKSSCWKNDMEKYFTSIDQNFKDDFPYKRFSEVTNEIEKIKKVLRWVNEKLMYSQQEECPYPLSARRILKHVEENKVTVNCLSHAIVLNECLHHLGIMSRIIFCLPNDINPIENHVMVHAYSVQYGKWIALDPSWNCYYCDLKGEIMSLAEIRKAIVNDLPFSIQYNHRKTIGLQSSHYKKYFVWENLYSYLCKNFFRFSYINNDSDKTITQYELFPVTILDKDIEIIKQREEHIIIQRYVTNEDEFWCVPSVIL